MNFNLHMREKEEVVDCFTYADRNTVNVPVIKHLN